MNCNQCGSEDLRIDPYDFGRDSETGYQDAGVRWTCRQCGAAGYVEELAEVTK